MTPRPESSLVEARTIKEVGAWACAEMNARIGLHAAVFIPAIDGVFCPGDQAYFTETASPEEIDKMGLESLPIASRELRMADMFLRAPVTFDSHRVYPLLGKTVTYNEFWAPLRIERQAVHVMGAGGTLFGWLAACRSIHQRAYADNDLAALGTVGESVTRAMRGLLSFPGRAPSDLAALHGLEHGIGWPCFVFGGDGHVLWLSDEAVVRLSVEALRFGNARFLRRWPPLLEALAEQARRVARSPSRAVAPSPGFLRRHLAEGEELVVRWCAGGAGSAPTVVVNVMNRGPELRFDTSRAVVPSCLTRREAEVAVLAAQGYSALNVAAHLNLSEATVRTHLKHAYTKLGIVNRAQLVLKMMGPAQR